MYNFGSSFIHNASKLETTQMSWTDEQINKLQYIYTIEYYSATKRNKNTDSHTTDESHKLAEYKKKDTKGYIPCDFIYMKF